MSAEVTARTWADEQHAQIDAIYQRLEAAHSLLVAAYGTANVRFEERGFDLRHLVILVSVGDAVVTVIQDGPRMTDLTTERRRKQDREAEAHVRQTLSDGGFVFLVQDEDDEVVQWELALGHPHLVSSGALRPERQQRADHQRCRHHTAQHPHAQWGRHHRCTHPPVRRRDRLPEVHLRRPVG